MSSDLVNSWPRVRRSACFCKISLKAPTIMRSDNVLPLDPFFFSVHILFGRGYGILVQAGSILSLPRSRPWFSSSPRPVLMVAHRLETGALASLPVLVGPAFFAAAGESRFSRASQKDAVKTDIQRRTICALDFKLLKRVPGFCGFAANWYSILSSSILQNFCRHDPLLTSGSLVTVLIPFGR